MKWVLQPVCNEDENGGLLDAGVVWSYSCNPGRVSLFAFVHFFSLVHTFYSFLPSFVCVCVCVCVCFVMI